MILKSEGYACYKKLGDTTFQFLEDFIRLKNKNLFESDSNNYEMMD